MNHEIINHEVMNKRKKLNSKIKFWKYKKSSLFQEINNFEIDNIKFIFETPESVVDFLEEYPYYKCITTINNKEIYLELINTEDIFDIISDEYKAKINRFRNFTIRLIEIMKSLDYTLPEINTILVTE
jgi:hypothetical protein